MILSTLSDKLRILLIMIAVTTILSPSAGGATTMERLLMPGEVILGHAEYEDKCVHSATMEWKIPSVIRFLKYVSNRKKAIKFSRENVYTRDKGKCQYCGDRVKRMEITYDHVVPRAKGGKTCWQNVVICCFGCSILRQE